MQSRGQSRDRAQPGRSRAGNLLIAGDHAFVPDRPSARTGAAFIAWLIMAPSVAMQGGPNPDELMSRFGLSRFSGRNFDATLCSAAGYFVVHALDHAPPGLPTVRACQAAQEARACLVTPEAWLGLNSA